MDKNIIHRMDEVVALKRRIKGVGMTIKEVCAECEVAPKTFSSWAAGRGRDTMKWDRVCEFVAKEESRDFMTPDEFQALFHGD